MWVGSSDTSPEHPDFAINTHGLSTAKILPALLKLIKNPKSGTFALDDSTLAESIKLYEAIPWDDAFTKVVSFLDSEMASDGFLFSALYKHGNVTARGAQIFTAIQELYPQMIKVEKRGSRDEYTFVGDISKIDQNKVLHEANPKHGDALDVVDGGEDEIEDSPEIAKLEKSIEKIDLEQSLNDLEDLLTGMIKKNLGHAVLVSRKAVV